MSRRRIASGLGVAGGLLTVLAGLVQLMFGDDIPAWTGNKLAPVPLGLLTVGLGGIAVLAAVRVGDRRASPLWALGLAGPGLLCLSTVGVLAWLPACVLAAAAALVLVDGWRASLRLLTAEPVRVLLSVLAAAELVMAAGAAPLLMVIGGLGGIALLAATWLRTVPPGPHIGLALLGVLPFAGAAWTGIVPLLFALVAAPLLVVVLRETHHRPETGTADATRSSTTDRTGGHDV